MCQVYEVNFEVALQLTIGDVPRAVHSHPKVSRTTAPCLCAPGYAGELCSVTICGTLAMLMVTYAPVGVLSLSFSSLLIPVSSHSCSSCCDESRAAAGAAAGDCAGPRVCVALHGLVESTDSHGAVLGGAKGPQSVSVLVDVSARSHASDVVATPPVVHIFLAHWGVGSR